MKSVLISIQPYWVFLIIAKAMGWNTNKEKTIEVRKNHPKDKCWDKVAKIYCSKDKKSFAKIPKEYQPFMEKFLGKVIGEFVCDSVITDKSFGHNVIFKTKACMTDADVSSYCLNKEMYCWHISDLVIYDKPRKLSEFWHYCGDNPKCDGCEAHYYSSSECGTEDYCCSVMEGCKPLTRPPQSWCYAEGGGSDA